MLGIALLISESQFEESGIQTPNIKTKEHYKFKIK